MRSQALSTEAGGKPVLSLASRLVSAEQPWVLPALEPVPRAPAAGRAADSTDGQHAYVYSSFGLTVSV